MILRRSRVVPRDLAELVLLIAFALVAAVCSAISSPAGCSGPINARSAALTREKESPRLQTAGASAANPCAWGALRGAVPIRLPQDLRRPRFSIVFAGVEVSKGLPVDDVAAGHGVGVPGRPSAQHSSAKATRSRPRKRRWYTRRAYEPALCVTARRAASCECLLPSRWRRGAIRCSKPTVGWKTAARKSWRPRGSPARGGDEAPTPLRATMKRTRKAKVRHLS